MFSIFAYLYSSVNQKSDFILKKLSLLKDRLYIIEHKIWRMNEEWTKNERRMNKNILIFAFLNKEYIGNTSWIKKYWFDLVFTFKE
jgi:hypothetical protein